ncbi:signal peptidase I [Staphylococcus agnetis]|uniref:signal peptidase I n=1 Tax=Staphylococcus agnetis TaxID=985762 RepID=UPI00208F04A4|nr:signal peptidase I [Staphylococcus agnetis]MCO4346760.1 signal peptidase I [Staphylococcus agnetis]
MKKELYEWFMSISIAIVVVLIINVFFISSYNVSGLSMYPTFNDGDRVIVSKISKTLNTLDNEDVIVFHKDSKRDYIKRIIGKPGDVVSYKNDKLFVNGKNVNEPYLEFNKKNKYGDFLTENFTSKDLKGSNNKERIPENKYLVLGDNRQNSIDSRRAEVGLIDEKPIVGKVVLRYWPFKDIRFGF